MKFLTETEAIALLGSNRKGTWARIFKNMEIGQILYITKEEWPHASEPSVYLGNYRVRSGMNWSAQTLPDNKGYLVKRIN